MNTKYIDLINQTYYFPQEEFTLNKDTLQFHNIDLMKLVEQYGTPLKFTYLPQISNNIKRAKNWFRAAMEKNKYEGKYYYCYCTKSSHFEYVMNEAFKNNRSEERRVGKECRSRGWMYHEELIIKI